MQNISNKIDVDRKKDEEEKKKPNKNSTNWNDKNIGCQFHPLLQ